MVEFGSFVGFVTSSGLSVPDPGCPPPTIYLIHLLCLRTVLILLNQEDSVRNTRKRKALPHVMKNKNKRQIQTLLILALSTALCIYNFILSAIHSFAVSFVVVIFQKEAETKQTNMENGTDV